MSRDFSVAGACDFAPSRACSLFRVYENGDLGVDLADRGAVGAVLDQFHEITQGTRTSTTSRPVRASFLCRSVRANCISVEAPCLVGRRSHHVLDHILVHDGISRASLRSCARLLLLVTCGSRFNRWTVARSIMSVSRHHAHATPSRAARSCSRPSCVSIPIIAILGIDIKPRIALQPLKFQRPRTRKGYQIAPENAHRWGKEHT